MDVTVIDRVGIQQDWAWVEANYGNVQIAPITGAGYRVIQVTEIEGPMAFTCTLLDINGAPVAGRQVAYIWPDGQSIEITNGSGVAEHSAGGGEGYDPNTMVGPITWQVPDANSEAISGLGWLWGTNHRHLNVIMRWSEGDGPEPEPPEPEEKWDEVIELLQAIYAKLDEMYEQDGKPRVVTL